MLGRRPIVLDIELLMCARSMTFHWHVFVDLKQQNNIITKGISTNHDFLEKMSKSIGFALPLSPDVPQTGKVAINTQNC